MIINNLHDRNFCCLYVSSYQLMLLLHIEYMYIVWCALLTSFNNQYDKETSKLVLDNILKFFDMT